MKALFLTLMMATFATCSFGQDISDGTWYNAEKTSRIEFFKKGEKLYGKIVWIKEPDENGKPKMDEFNPDKSKRSDKLLGLVFLKDFVKDGPKGWEDGTIYDPRDGKTYSCTITEESVNKLKVRGYIGISLIGKTAYFTRATK